MSAPPESGHDGKNTMRAMIRSDLFRNFLGGFLLGVVALVALSPSDRTDTLKAKIEAIYKA